MTRQRQNQALKARDRQRAVEQEGVGDTNRSPEHSSRMDFRTTTSFHHHAVTSSAVEDVDFLSLESLACVVCTIVFLNASRYFAKAILNGVASDGCRQGYVGRI